MNDAWRLEFELRVRGLADSVRIRIGEAGERCMASVQVGSDRTSGIGANAREALVAALSPFGARTCTTVMAAPDMFAASAQLMLLRSAG